MRRPSVLYRFGLRLALACLALGHGATLGQSDAVNLQQTYPIPDPMLGEQIREGEIDAAARLIATLRKEIETVYKDGEARRDAHPKAHGCINAEFEVAADLPKALRHGVFQPGHRYNALIRYSNGSPNASGKDITGDTRGMAVKLFGVQGEKLFPIPEQPDIQDFILISSPFFFINEAEGYAEFFEIVDEGTGWDFFKIPFILGARGSWNAYKMLSQTIANPLSTRYWSVVPYQLGEAEQRQAVKYSAKPCEPSDQQIPNDPSDNYLREAMVSTLSNGDACMTFMVQPRVGDLSVEDAILEWPEEEAPFYPVATITMPAQEFDTPAKNASCENQSYNPWHTLPAHKPLGMVNRLRRVVYESISDLRHNMNNTQIPNSGEAQ